MRNLYPSFVLKKILVIAKNCNKHTELHCTISKFIPKKIRFNGALHQTAKNWWEMNHLRHAATSRGFPAELRNIDVSDLCKTSTKKLRLGSNQNTSPDEMLQNTTPEEVSTWLQLQKIEKRDVIGKHLHGFRARWLFNYRLKEGNLPN